MKTQRPQGVVSRRDILKLGGTALGGTAATLPAFAIPQTTRHAAPSQGPLQLEALAPKSVQGDLLPKRSINGQVLNIGEFIYQNGLGTSSPFEAIYKIPSGYERFDAWVGFDIASAPGRATFQVLVDGRLKFSSGIRSYSPYSRSPECNPRRPMKVSVSVKGASTLALRVALQEGSGQVLVDWADAQLCPQSSPEFVPRKKVAGIAEAPPMGWNPYYWNGSGKHIDLLKEIADAMVDKGFRDAGYRYLNLDGGWTETPSTDERGYPQPRKSMFPEGIQPLSDYVHSKGLKFRIYASMKMVGRDERQQGMWNGGHEKQWVESFDKWGVDYLKYDFSTRDGNYFMLKAIKESDRPIFYNCCAWGHDADWNWAYFMGAHSMRSTYDVNNIWEHGNDINPVGIMDAIDQGEAIGQFTGPGFWNDLDMLVVGLKEGTVAPPPRTYRFANQIEQRTQFSLYSMMAATLIIGCDIRNLDDYSRETLLNREVIAIDQDPLGVAAWRVVKLDDIEIWKRPLDNGDWAVSVLNRGEDATAIKAVWDDMHLSGKFKVRDLWKHDDLGSYDEELTLNVESHETKMLRFSALGQNPQWGRIAGALSRAAWVEKQAPLIATYGLANGDLR